MEIALQNLYRLASHPIRGFPLYQNYSQLSNGKTGTGQIYLTKQLITDTNTMCERHASGQPSCHAKKPYKKPYFYIDLLPARFYHNL